MYFINTLQILFCINCSKYFKQDKENLCYFYMCSILYIIIKSFAANSEYYFI